MKPTHAWARHAIDRLWHRVAAIENGSLITLCRGRWSTSDSYATTAIALPAFVTCSACTTYPIEQGLAELAAWRG